MNPCSAITFFFLLVVLTGPLTAHEWDARWPGDRYTFTARSFHQHAAPVADGGGWVADDSGGATRFSAAAEVLARTPGTAISVIPGQVRVLHNLPDGGVLLLASGFLPRAVRLDAQGRVVWQQTILTSSPMATAVAGDRGSVWWIDTGTQTLRTLAPDGETHFSRTAAELGLASLQALAVSADGNLALIAGPDAATGTRIASARVWHDGVIRSTWTGPTVLSTAAAINFAAVRDADHALLVFADSSGRLALAHHPGEGTPTVSLLEQQFNTDGYQVRTTRTGYVLGSDVIGLLSNHVYLQFLSSTGTLVAAHNLPVGTSVASLVSASDDAAWAIGYSEGVAGLRLVRAVPASVTITSVPAFPRSNAFAILAPSATEIFLASDAQIFRANLSGQLTTLESNFDISVVKQRAMATTDSAGESYVIQRRYNQAIAEHTLSRIGRDGRLRWTVPVAPELRFATGHLSVIDSTGITANAERVCYYTGITPFIYCHGAGDGAFQAGIEIAIQEAQLSIELTPGNALLLRRRLGGAEPAQAWNAQNLPIARANYTNDMLLARFSNSSGHYVHFEGATAAGISTIHRTWRGNPGNVQPAITWALGAAHAPAFMEDGQPALLLREDGSALLVSFAPGDPPESLLLRKLNADGSLGFSVDLGYGSLDARELASEVVGLSVVNDQILVRTFVEVLHPLFVYPGIQGLSAFDVEDGQHLWTLDPILPLRGAALELQIEPDGTHAHWWTVDYLDISARRIRLADGVEVMRTDFPCSQFCAIDRVRVDSRGATLLPSVDRRERDPFTPQVRADQEVLDGAWYQAETSGQGVLFDYLPESRAWFGTWHTFQLPGRTGLRWFTLQGEASADGRHAELGVYVALGGRFDNGPPVSSTRIGSARLTFETCTSANLEYQFTSGVFAGQSGSIPLRPLLPHAEACAGFNEPPAAVNSSTRNGISTQHSGTWYEQATSGQGLEITIRPTLGDGLIFAGWFTYTPEEGAAAIPRRQHWFTLQGDLSTAVDGVVTLPIFRTIGGSFDSSWTRNTSRVGEATLRFLECNQAQLHYRFDESAVADLFAGHVGVIPLQRIGACPLP